MKGSSSQVSSKRMDLIPVPRKIRLHRDVEEIHKPL